jgi:extracellular factor (EF) 3-hydroxypalmitic acid methyl ester biosynthesis protein
MPTARRRRIVTDSLVSFRNSQGVEASGTLVHLSRNAIVFEVYNPYSIVQLSEVLTNFHIHRGERSTYQGRAVVTNLVNTGLLLIATASLVDPWSDLASLLPGEQLRGEVADFVEDWQDGHQSLLPDFKKRVNDIRNFLIELRRWLEHGEAVSGITEPKDGRELVREFVRDVDSVVTPRIFELYEQFEEASDDIPKKLHGLHSAYVQRELHPLVMCSPFVHRSFTKPLGYAGDYEMVNMMLGDPWQGNNTYAKIINASVLCHDAPRAHRNRIRILTEMLEEETRRRLQQGERLTVLNVGCGPAVELQHFLEQTDLCNHLDVELVDFNPETLDYARRELESRIAAYAREIRPTFTQRSVNDLIKEATGQAGNTRSPVDVVYCAGLFDYFGDPTCECLLELYLSWVNPGGLVVATNVTPHHSSTGFMNLLLEWNLRLRTAEQMLRLAPQGGTTEVFCDETGMNVFLKIRKNAGVAH